MQSQNLWELACYKIGGRIIAANEKKLVKKLESLYQQLKNRVLPVYSVFAFVGRNTASGIKKIKTGWS